MGYHRSTFAEKQYVKGMVRNLSLLRWSDQEITDYLHNEKNMQISRPSVTIIKNNIEKEAEKWYIELKSSRYKFIAMYKERLDSLLSYQKTLNDIVTTTKKEENKIRAIATLQSIELDIFNIYKQLPDVRIEETIVNNNKEQDQDSPQLPDPDSDQVWGSEPSPSVDDAIPIAVETTITKKTSSLNTTTTTSTSKEEKEADDYVWKL